MIHETANFKRVYWESYWIMLFANLALLACQKTQTHELCNGFWQESDHLPQIKEGMGLLHYKYSLEQIYWPLLWLWFPLSLTQVSPLISVSPPTDSSINNDWSATGVFRCQDSWFNHIVQEGQSAKTKWAKQLKRANMPVPLTLRHSRQNKHIYSLFGGKSIQKTEHLGLC